MTTIVFDTLKLSRKLKAGGFSPEQADTLAEALGETSNDELVTRDYLDAKLQEVNANIHEAKAEMIKWLAGLLIAQAALVAALVKLL